MESDTATASGLNGGGEVMAAVDGTPKRLVIADVSRDDAWLAMRLDGTVTVSDHA